MLKNYFLIACKVYARRKMFTAINLLCIVLTLVVLLSVTAILQNTFYPTGVEGKSERFLQANRIVQTHKTAEGYNKWTGGLGFKVIDQYMRKMKSVELVAAVTEPSSVAIYQQDRVVNVKMRRSDSEYWRILDFKVLLGRLYNADDVQQGRFLAVVNASTAKKLFGELNVLGKKINAGGQQFEVIGVVEDVLHLNAYSDLWVPLTTFPTSGYKDQTMGGFSALLLAKSAADLPLIKDEMLQVTALINKENQSNSTGKTFIWVDTKLDFFARLLLGDDEKADSGATSLVTAIVALMLVFMALPALNLINLNSGRIMERATEIGVRKAFGANNRQLVGQFIFENILLCMVGGVIGLICAQLILVWLGQSGVIPYLQVELNASILFFGFLITVVFGILSGVTPAWKMSRLDPVFALKGGV